MVTYTTTISAIYIESTGCNAIVSRNILRNYIKRKTYDNGKLPAILLVRIQRFGASVSRCLGDMQREDKDGSKSEKERQGRQKDCGPSRYFSDPELIEAKAHYCSPAA
jgi:hypothetical protein